MYQLIRTSMNKYSIRPLSTCVDLTRSILTLRDMPHPRGLPMIGTKLDVLMAGRGTRLHDYVDSRHKELGTIFCDRLGSKTDLVFISDPALMKSLFINLEGKYPAHILPDPWVLYEKLYGFKRGLLFMDGEEWLTNRRIANKHLLREDSDTWIRKPVTETIDKVIHTWIIKAEKGCGITNLESELYKISTQIIINILLGANSSVVMSKHYDELLTLFSDSVKNIFVNTTKLHGLPLKWCVKLNIRAWKSFKESVDLSLFLARKIVYEMLQNKKDNTGLIKRLIDDKISDETITRIVSDFVIAAGDTTAYTTLWILLLLSKNREVIEDLRMKNDSYVKYIVKESMRLYPVAPFLTRILPKDSFLGPYKLKEGTPVIASIYTSGRDERNFSKPDMFLPYRWDRNDPRKHNLSNHVPSASLPFALGTRSCIGKKIAMIQLTEVVTQIVNNFDFMCTNSTNVIPITSQVLVPNKKIGLSLKLKKQ